MRKTLTGLAALLASFSVAACGDIQNDDVAAMKVSEEAVVDAPVMGNVDMPEMNEYSPVLSPGNLLGGEILTHCAVALDKADADNLLKTKNEKDALQYYKQEIGKDGFAAAQQWAREDADGIITNKVDCVNYYVNNVIDFKPAL